jgi:hypothetical protein
MSDQQQQNPGTGISGGAVAPHLVIENEDSFNKLLNSFTQSVSTLNQLIHDHGWHARVVQSKTTIMFQLNRVEVSDDLVESEGKRLWAKWLSAKAVFVSQVLKPL